MMGKAKAADRARVVALLIEPLAGLGRPKRVSAEKHEANLANLEERLAYLSDGELSGLRDVVLRHAARGLWPEVGFVMAWAFDLHCPPPAFSDYHRSLISSAMGRQARDEGWAVELYQIAKRLGPPPGKYIELDASTTS